MLPIWYVYLYIICVTCCLGMSLCTKPARKNSQTQTPKAFSAQEVHHFPDHSRNSRNPYQSISCYCKWSWISKLFLETWSFCHWKVIWIYFDHLDHLDHLDSYWFPFLKIHAALEVADLYHSVAPMKQLRLAVYVSIFSEAQSPVFPVFPVRLTWTDAFSIPCISRLDSSSRPAGSCGVAACHLEPGPLHLAVTKLAKGLAQMREILFFRPLRLWNWFASTAVGRPVGLDADVLAKELRLSIEVGILTYQSLLRYCVWKNLSCYRSFFIFKSFALDCKLGALHVFKFAGETSQHSDTLMSAS